MKVLVAIEDEDDGLRLAENIRNRDWPSGTEFHLVHVIGVRTGAELEKRVHDLEKEIEATSGAAVKLLAGISKQLEKFLPHAKLNSHVCVSRDVPAEILAEISDAQPQIVIIGKHSRENLQYVLHRSVSERLLPLMPANLDSVHVVEIPPLPKTAHVTIV
jgi:nucleotide-binding universal stress UspA family protein